MINSLKNKMERFIKGIFAKFVLAFIVVGLIPLIVMGYLVFERLPVEIEKYMISNIAHSLVVASSEIDTKVSQYDKITRLIYNYSSSEYDSLQGVISDNEDYYSDLDQQRILFSFLRSVMLSEENIENVFYLDSDNQVVDYISRNMNLFIDSVGFKSLPNYENLQTDARELKVLPTHKEEYFKGSLIEVVTFARNYLDINQLPQKESVIGTLLVNVNIDAFKSVFRRLELEDLGDVTIVDENGNMIYMSSKGESEYIDEIDNIKGYKYVDGKYLFLQEIEGVEWKILYNIPKGEIFRFIKELERLNLIVILIIAFMLFSMAIIFSKQLSNPIKSIIRQMKKAESGDLKTRVNIESSYEFNQLANAFNVMIERLNEYISKAYIAQINQKEAELNAIKTQIRPHYLYNTLEVIRMSAIMEDAFVTQEMIYSLSEQLKYLIGDTKDKVNLITEIDMVKNYFKIAKESFQNNISLDLDIPKEYENCIVLKLSIQPIVENAVVHGIKPNNRVGKVQVIVRKVESFLIIRVMDNGIGMSKEKVKELKEHITIKSSNNKDYSKVGLKNVHERISMTYGSDCGLFINSRINFGTLVELKIPFEE